MSLINSKPAYFAVPWLRWAGLNIIVTSMICLWLLWMRALIWEYSPQSCLECIQVSYELIDLQHPFHPQNWTRHHSGLEESTHVWFAWVWSLFCIESSHTPIVGTLGRLMVSSILSSSPHNDHSSCCYGLWVSQGDCEGNQSQCSYSRTWQKVHEQS